MKSRSKNIVFGITDRMADIRTLSDIKEVVYDKKWLKSQSNFDLYYIYRDLYKNESDGKIIKQNNLRYDITIIPPKLLGSEFVKTLGHYHPIINKSNLSYTEIYQVLEGQATYLLQKIKKDRSVEDFIVIKAKKMDYVIIPPNYGHTTINESNKTLKMANWVCDNFSSEYELIKKMNGLAYFLTTKGFVKNLKYKNVPKIRKLKAINFSKYGLKKGVNMYNLVKNIDQLKFLINPENFSPLFSKIVAD